MSSFALLPVQGEVCSPGPEGVLAAGLAWPRVFVFGQWPDGWPRDARKRDRGQPPALAVWLFGGHERLLRLRCL